MKLFPLAPRPRLRARPGRNLPTHDASQRGGARLSLLLTLLAVAVVGYGVSSYAPVAYRAAEYKDEMQKRVDQAAAYGYTGEWVDTQLRLAARDYDLPTDAKITTAVRDGRIEAQVSYTRPVALPGFVYEYEFDHTARSGTFFRQ